jgi:hypothetical protein
MLYRNTLTIKGDRKEYFSILNQMVHNAAVVLVSATSLSCFINVREFGSRLNLLSHISRAAGDFEKLNE